MQLHREYAPDPRYPDNPNKKIQFSVRFNRDQTNWATNQPKKIGYEVSVTPVTIEGIWHKIEAFTGFNANLLEVERRSKKREAKAIEILQERKEEFLNYFKPGTNGN